MKFIGTSRSIVEARSRAERLASNSEPVLITGENGAGKTHMARFIHVKSKREAEPFVVFGASDGLSIEKNLFGFTGSSLLGIENITPGAIDAAGSGTIVIKDLQLIPAEVQVQLLATVQLRCYRPLNSEETLKATCRFVFTMPSVAERFLKEKKLLPELAQLLAGNTIHLPLLKNRPEDIETLSNYFLNRWCENLNLTKKTFTKAALKLLKKSAWPGNVAELQTLILSALLHFNGTCIEARHLQLKIDGNWHAHTDSQLEEIALEEIIEKKIGQFMQRLGRYEIENLYDAIITRVEKPLIKLAMERSGKNQLKAAKILGINRNTLRTKLQKLEIA